MTKVNLGRLEQLCLIAKDRVSKAAEAKKTAFVDPMTAGGAAAGGGAPPMDPAAGGGAPPMDPAMMDPAAMGGMPPMDPAALGGGGEQPPGVSGEEIRAIIQQEMANQGGAAGAGAGGEGGIKPKIDVNVEIMQMKNILAMIADSLGVQIPAQQMVATPEKLTAMAQGEDPNAGDVGPGGGGSAISPIEPMQGASPALAAGGGEAAPKMASDGVPYEDTESTTGVTNLTNRASALASILAARV